MSQTVRRSFSCLLVIFMLGESCRAEAALAPNPQVESGSRTPLYLTEAISPAALGMLLPFQVASASHVRHFLVTLGLMATMVWGRDWIQIKWAGRKLSERRLRRDMERLSDKMNLSGQHYGALYEDIKSALPLDEQMLLEKSIRDLAEELQKKHPDKAVTATALEEQEALGCLVALTYRAISSIDHGRSLSVEFIYDFEGLLTVYNARGRTGSLLDHLRPSIAWLFTLTAPPDAPAMMLDKMIRRNRNLALMPEFWRDQTVALQLLQWGLSNVESTPEARSPCIIPLLRYAMDRIATLERSPVDQEEATPLRRGLARVLAEPVFQTPDVQELVAGAHRYQVPEWIRAAAREQAEHAVPLVRLRMKNFSALAPYDIGDLPVTVDKVFIEYHKEANERMWPVWGQESAELTLNLYGQTAVQIQEWRPREPLLVPWRPAFEIEALERAARHVWGLWGTMRVRYQFPRISLREHLASFINGIMEWLRVSMLALFRLTAVERIRTDIAKLDLRMTRRRTFRRLHLRIMLPLTPFGQRLLQQCVTQVTREFHLRHPAFKLRVRDVRTHDELGSTLALAIRILEFVDRGNDLPDDIRQHFEDLLNQYNSRESRLRSMDLPLDIPLVFSLVVSPLINGIDMDDLIRLTGAMAKLPPEWRDRVVAMQLHQLAMHPEEFETIDSELLHAFLPFLRRRLQNADPESPGTRMLQRAFAHVLLLPQYYTWQVRNVVRELGREDVMGWIRELAREDLESDVPIAWLAFDFGVDVVRYRLPYHISQTFLDLENHREGARLIVEQERTMKADRGPKHFLRRNEDRPPTTREIGEYCFRLYSDAVQAIENWGDDIEPEPEMGTPPDDPQPRFPESIFSFDPYRMFFSPRYRHRRIWPTIPLRWAA